MKMQKAGNPVCVLYSTQDPYADSLQWADGRVLLFRRMVLWTDLLRCETGALALRGMELRSQGAHGWSRAQVALEGLLVLGVFS